MSLEFKSKKPLDYRKDGKPLDYAVKDGLTVESQGIYKSMDKAEKEKGNGLISNLGLDPDLQAKINEIEKEDGLKAITHSDSDSKVKSEETKDIVSKSKYIDSELEQALLQVIESKSKYEKNQNIKEHL